MSQKLPENILQWFYQRGITDETLSHFDVSWTGTHIKIPISKTAYKLRRSPFNEDGQKYLNPKGNPTLLFKSDEYFLPHSTVIVCEGELDVMRLHSAGYQACCSTGGAGTFKKEWVVELPMPSESDLYICYDNDSAGVRGALNAHRMVPGSKIVWLPKIVGDHGDVTDYFKLVPSSSFPDYCRKYSYTYYLPDDIDEKSTKKDKITRIKGIINDLMDMARGVRVIIGKNARTDEPEQFLIKLFLAKLESLNKKKAKVDEHSLETIESAKKVPISNFLEFDGGSMRCIFHKETTPSMHYYPANNKVFCFGCRKSADVLDVIQELRQCTLSEAIKIALNKM